MELARRHWKLVAGGAAALIVVGIVAGIAILGGTPPVASATPSPTPSPSASPSPSPSPTPTPTPEPSPTPKPVALCPLNGLPAQTKAHFGDPALAVQIENHPQARPVHNLGNADMVVEATVEGDVTRYTGIFLCHRTVGLTGPVRSSRYYLIDLWQDMHVLPYFFGGAREALNRFAAAGMPYVNGITGAWPWFERAGSAPAPHNLYTDLEAVRGDFDSNAALAARAERVKKLRPPFTFRDGARPPGGRRLGHVEIWTNGYWHFGWTWDPGSGTWLRSEAGVPNVDAATGRQLAATAVVVQHVREDVDYSSHDPGGNPRRFHHLVGTGNATLYVDGRAVELRWSRPTSADRTRWTVVSSGRRLVLPPGVVWWEIMPIGSRIDESS